MNRLILISLKRFAAIFGWRWLYFIAGIGLLSSIQSCKERPIKKCYSPVVPDNDTIVQPRCYDMPAPQDTVPEIHDDNE